MRGLLHRLATQGSAATTKSDVASRVLTNLQAVLNTHVGDGHTCPDLGVDFMELLARWPASEFELVSLVTKAVQQFEPRLSNVQVRILKRETAVTGLSMEIQGELLGERRLRLVSDLNRGGGVGVR